MSEQHDRARLEQRSLTFKQPGWPMTCEDRKIHVRCLAGGRALPIEEIRVAIDEPQAAAAGERAEYAEEQRAISAEDEGTLASIEDLAHPGADRERGPADVRRADYAGTWVAARVANARFSLSGVARAQTLE